MTELNASGPAELMSDERLAEIRAREQGVPPAPWRSEDDARTLERWILSEDGTLEIGLGYVGNRTEDVAAFIVQARQDIPDLLAEVERLRVLRSKDMRWEARLAEGVLSGQDSVNDLAEQVKRVRDLHSPVTGLPGTGGPVCRHCVTYDGQTVPAPCPTIRALDGTEAGR